MIHFANQKFPNPSGVELTEWEKVRPIFKQVHGVRVARVQKDAESVGEVDGLWTTRAQFPIGIVTADCVPVLLEYQQPSKSVQAVAALHAGWRGVYDNILSAFFEQLENDPNSGEFCNRSRWVVHIGPSIRLCCYEVSSELITQFHARYPNLELKQLDPTHRKLDLIAVLQHQAQMLGIRIKSVHPDCTFCAVDSQNQSVYFSYRRGDRCSRQYSTIWID